MKDKRNQINRLKLEIEELSLKIVEVEKSNMHAFARRLTKILELKENKLQAWIRLQ